MPTGIILGALCFGGLLVLTVVVFALKSPKHYRRFLAGIIRTRTGDNKKAGWLLPLILGFIGWVLFRLVLLGCLPHHPIGIASFTPKGEVIARIPAPDYSGIIALTGVAVALCVYYIQPRTKK